MNICLIAVHTLLQAFMAGASSPSFVIGATFMVGFGIYLCFYRWKQRNKKGPKAWPVLGALLEVLCNYETLHDWLVFHFERANTFPVSMPGGFSYTCTADPAVVEYVLKTNFSNFPKGKVFQEIMEELLGKGIFNSDGDAWRQQRKIASFEFASKNLRVFSTAVFREYAITLANILSHAADHKSPMDMQDLLMRLTLDSICKIGFGIEIGNLSPKLPDVPFAKAFDNANYTTVLRFIDPFWKLKRILKIGSEAILRHSIRAVDDFAYKVIKTRKREIAEAKTGRTVQHTKPDLLSRFIALSEDVANGFDDKSLRDIVLNFVIAGRDTTAVTLSWFIYMLTLHPDVGDKIYEELMAFQNKHSGNLDQEACRKKNFKDFAQLLTFDTVTELQYLYAAIQETLRLYPAVPEDPKGILADDVFPDGTKVKKGGMVAYSPYGMGRMKDLWGSDANEYKPERWFTDGVFVNASPFKFITFQAGPRICLGKDSAYLQMKMTAALLCRFFKFELVPGHIVKYKMMLILSMAQGLKVTVSPRP